MADVIRLSKKQKECIEKLIPALIAKFEHSKELSPEFGSLYDDYIEYVNNRDYSIILSWLLPLAAHELEVELN